MKYIWLMLRLLLAVAAIVLLVLSIKSAGDGTNWFLSGGLLCSTLGIWLNIWCQRRERNK